jgi:hypothetical protein
MPTLRFEAEPHKYYLDDVELPSVTNVLNVMGLTDNTWAKDHHRRRGTAVHDLCSLLDEVMMAHPHQVWESHWDIIAQSSWDMEKTHPKLVPYGLAYARFLQQSGFVAKYVELTVCSPSMRLAGTLDRWGHLNGFFGQGSVLIDIKSGAPAPASVIQISLYDHLFHEWVADAPVTDRMFALQLKDTEDFKLHPLPIDKRNLHLGLSAVSLYHWRNSNRLVKNGANNGPVEQRTEQ